MKYIWLILSLNSSAWADTDLERLKTSFAPLITGFNEKLASADNLAPRELDLGNSITLEQCLAKTNEITKNYLIDPFDFRYDEGSAKFNACGGPWGFSPNFLLKQNGRNSFGLDYSNALQAISELSGDRSITHIFLDNHNTMVEIMELNYRATNYGKDWDLIGYSITSMDKERNAYYKSYRKNITSDQRRIAGPETRIRYIANDGSTGSGVFRYRHVNEIGPMEDYQSTTYSSSDRKDWQNFALPLTYVWLGGYFNYGGHFSPYPNYFRELTVKTRNGSENCAFGFLRNGPEWHSTPSSQEEFYHCFNL